MSHPNKTQSDLTDLFKNIVSDTDYEKVAQKNNVSEEVLRLEHIEFARNQSDYDKQIQKFTIKLIQDVGVYLIRAMNEDAMAPVHKSEYTTIKKFFSARAVDLIPYTHRDAAKSLACRYVKELESLYTTERNTCIS